MPPQVFGKTLVCRNMDVAAKAAKESNLNCVTMEGDQVGYAVGVGMCWLRQAVGLMICEWQHVLAVPACALD